MEVAYLNQKSRQKEANIIYVIQFTRTFKYVKKVCNRYYMKSKFINMIVYSDASLRDGLIRKYAPVGRRKSTLGSYTDLIFTWKKVQQLLIDVIFLTRF